MCACFQVYMKMNTIEKLRDCLRDMSPQIEMPEDIRDRLLKMVEGSGDGGKGKDGTPQKKQKPGHGSSLGKKLPSSADRDTQRQIKKHLRVPLLRPAASMTTSSWVWVF